MKKHFTLGLILCIFTVLTAGQAAAQTTSELQLGLSRDFGYGGFGNDIQGLFSVKIKNPPQNLARVEFYIDSALLGEVAQSPFSLQFNTDSYSLGTHTLSAIGYTAEGTELQSNTIQANFVPASAGSGMIVKVVVPIVGLVILMMVLAFVLPTFLNRGKGKVSALPLGSARNYGIGGGAICPKCGRPFPLRLWFLNLGFNKIDRCPYCGKWSFVRPRSLEELRAAEAAELASAQPQVAIPGVSEADKLKKELEDSRYQNM
ncbi:MAG: Ig-like domain-containing protein [Acidobacteriaceae bacterium]